MGARKLTDEQMELAKVWFCKGLIPSEEIATRLGMSRQGIVAVLKRMGVNTEKRRMVVKCSHCDELVDKTRAEVRKHEDHFCSTACFNSWMARPEVGTERQRMHVARGLMAERGLSTLYPTPAIYAGKEIYVFETREQMLEWKRTGLPMKVWAMGPHKQVEITYSQVKREEL